MDKHKNIVIGLLLAVVLVMAVGYAAFATQLTINGTANITSTWDVRIKSITAMTPVGDASNVSTTVDPDSGLTATFEANLVSPGDQITYSISVENAGSLDAKLDDLSFTEEENPAIEYSYLNIKKDDVIKSKNEQVFTVTIKYSDDVTEQPENKTETLKMTLSYVQDKETA